MEDEVSVSDLFERFIEATTMRNVMGIHTKILDFANLQPCEFNTFFPRYKRAVTSNRQRKSNWKAKALFSKIEKRANHKCYSNTKAPQRQQSINQCDTSASQQTGLDESWSSQINSRSNLNNSNNNNSNNALRHYKSLVIGSGPAGLRTAIELQLLGAERVVIVEKRNRFSRNNVLHLWPFVIDDLKSLGAKKFYGKFCAGSIDHISIRQLQLILLKVCLMIGCDFRDSCSYISLCPSSIRKEIAQLSSDDGDLKIETETDETCEYERLLASSKGGLQEPDQEIASMADAFGETNTQIRFGETECDSNTRHQGATSPGSETTTTMAGQRSPPRQRKPGTLSGASAHFECDRKTQEEELHSLKWDVIIGADGHRNALKNFFPRKEFRGRLAIAITANFINRQTPAETSVPEISGLSFIYNQEMFNALACDTNIVLENICYYKDDTHYFVMTAKKKSLLERGVLISDYATTQDLLAEANVNRANLLKYAKDVAYWTTGLEPLDFALNHYGQADCAMFDFTSMYAATNACKALRTKYGGLTLVGLVGDSLLEPFWPTGSGCARGFLSSFDAAWMCRQWAVNRCAVLDLHHNSESNRSSRSRNLHGSNGNDRSLLGANTYDRMALSVMAERESIYRILAQTTSENLQQNYSHWTLNPHTRYPHLNRTVILPSQVEHLIADGSKPPPVDRHLLSPGSKNSRRNKSPDGTAKSRRSPKKLKSAGASPSSHPRYSNNKKTLYKQGLKSKSRHELAYDQYYLELEESYRNLADTEKGGMTQYLNYKRRDFSGLDDLFIPSISGTLPSSNNLSKLEARKARDIDECLRQRRQKTKITLVRDQLISQMRGENQKDKNGGPLFPGGNATLFNEIKRMREQQSRGIRAESKPRDNVTGPLSLLNSMRRCASFAERVKSFESKLTNQDSADSSTVSTPRTPIENVKNLPQFATLQELIINSAQKPEGDQTRKLPISKLTKEDWNVKCWENRLSASKQRHLSVSSRSLNKSVSVDSANSRLNKPQKQVDVFQDRILQMANKLDNTKEKQAPQKIGAHNKTNKQQPIVASVRSQGWVNHLKRELTKGSEFGVRNATSGQPALNPATNQPIKKLFDDDEDDDGIDVNKHYDHLCINRPTNKYLAKGSYTSHLARPSNSALRVVNPPNPTAESKRAYLTALTSRGSSASSTLSDYSTNTGHSSSGSNRNKQTSTVIDVECFRCRKFVSSSDRITIGTSLLHRSCLTCAKCGLTLKSNEIQHHMTSISEARAKSENRPSKAEIKFMCNLCSPEIRVAIAREASVSLNQAEAEYKDLRESSQQQHHHRHHSREAFFLDSRINYEDIYKNILVKEQKKTCGADGKEDLATPQIVFSSGNSIYSSKLSPPRVFSESDDRPLSEASSRNNDTEVTLILPCGSATPSSSATNPDEEGTLSCKPAIVERCQAPSERQMIDEEELERILHLDKRETGRKSSTTSTSADGSSESSSNGGGGNTDEDTTSKEKDEASSSLDDDDDEDECDRKQVLATSATARGSSSRNRRLQLFSQTTNAHIGTSDSDGSSSLDLHQEEEEDEDEDDDEDDDENDDENDDEDEDEDDNDTTCDDFITTEEFDVSSDKDEEEAISNGIPHGGTPRESKPHEMSAG